MLTEVIIEMRRLMAILTEEDSSAAEKAVEDVMCILEENILEEEM